MALNTNKREGDKLHAEEWNELVQEVQGKQSRLNIVDALDSDSAVDVLSAKQGKMLKGMIDNATTNVNNVADVVKTLPVGYFYGTFSTEESLPTEITEKGYAYVGTENPHIIYTFDTALGWTATENKYSIPILETDLSTGSEVKAPTTKAVKEGIEAIDVTTEQEFTSTQKETARTNIGAQENITSMQDKFPVVAALNDRVADVVPVTNEVKALGYKVLNPNQSFVSQVVDANTVYEIRDFFDISGTEQSPATVIIPANCKLRFEGGMLGGEYVTLQGNNTLIESDSVCIQKDITIAGTWGNDTIYTKWLEFVSAKDAYLPASAGTTGVMAPFFEDTTYYKSGRNYVLLEEKPDDWQTDWEDYYQIVDNAYVSVEAVAPPYTKNNYYEFYDGTYHLISTDEAPSDWETNYMDYFINNSGTPVTGVAPEFKNDTFYKDNGVGYEKLLERPNDWLTNWSDYFVKNGNNYETPMGIIDNPYPTNNSVVFKQLQNLINGTHGCVVEFEKGYYQSSIIDATPNKGTTEVNGVLYQWWDTAIYVPDRWIVLNILDIPFIEIRLNGSVLKGLKNTCPMWTMIRYTGTGNVYVHDGEVEGFANRFNYPYYANKDKSIINNYEFGALIQLFGKRAVIENIISHNHGSDGIYIGSGKWYYIGGESPHYNYSGLRIFPCDSFEVKNCEIYECGRNGLVCLSSNSEFLNYVHIHNIGSDAGDGIIGSDGIMGRDPRAGIDVEFEDGLGMQPIVSWNNLNIHDCGKDVFGFAAPRSSKMKKFNATNLRIEGNLLTNNLITSDGLPTFNNCYIINGYNFYGRAIYRNCTFDIRRRIILDHNTFIDCKFVDNIESSNGSCFGANYGKATFKGCYMSLNHESYLVNDKLIECQIDFDTNIFEIPCGGSEFDNCKITAKQTVPLSGTNLNVSFRGLNNFNAVIFKNCTFDNLIGSSTGEGRKGFYGLPFTFENCKGNITVCSTIYDLVLKECSGGVLIISGYGNTGLNTINVLGCKFDSWLIYNIPYEIITVRDSVVSFASTGQCTYHCKFVNCDITYGQTSAYYQYIDGNKIFDSRVFFVNNASNANSENKITLTNSYIKGTATQAAFKGTAIDCVFENNADKGTDVQRPAYNLVVGQRYYDTTLGKPIFWNGTAWVDGNGNLLTEIQVSDRSVLLQAAANSSNVVEVYTSDAPSIAVKNPDDTTATWMTATLSGTELTITATSANTIIVAPEWAENTYYSESGGEYTLLTSNPANWDTNYADYYTEEDGVYSSVEGVVASATSPRGGKVILTNTNDEVVINVIQSY